MKKIVFLDIDGVLNHEQFMIKREKEFNHLSHIDLGVCQIDPEKIGLLNMLIECTNCYFVISSTWRISYWGDLPEIFNRLNFYNKEAEKRILDKTPISSCSMCYRGNEIYNWMQHNNQFFDGAPYYRFKNYVILDDDSDMLYWQKDNFIQTDGKIGLTENDVKKAIDILNKEYIK